MHVRGATGSTVTRVAPSKIGDVGIMGTHSPLLVSKSQLLGLVYNSLGSFQYGTFLSYSGLTSRQLSLGIYRDWSRDPRGPHSDIQVPWRQKLKLSLPSKHTLLFELFLEDSDHSAVQANAISIAAPTRSENEDEGNVCTRSAHLSFDLWLAQLMDLEHGVTSDTCPACVTYPRTLHIKSCLQFSEYFLANLSDYWGERTVAAGPPQIFLRKTKGKQAHTHCSTHRLLWVQARLVSSIRRLSCGRTLAWILLPVSLMPRSRYSKKT